MTSRCAREGRALLAAVLYFTRLPLPPLPALAADDWRRATSYWPVIGTVIATLCAGVWSLALLAWPPSLAAGVTLAAAVVLTGALQEDGFADVCDGLGGSASRERALEIMRDSRLGTFGVTGLVLLLGLKWQALATLLPVHGPLVLIPLHALSRAGAAALMAVLPYARDDHGKARPVVGPPSRDRCLVLALGGLAPLALLPPALWLPCLLTVALVWQGCRWWYGRRLGGYTGDCLGAAQQLGELALLLLLVAWP